jgi:uncharacterized protein (UPF0276 family)
LNRPFIGHGVGLRVPHYERALEGRLDVDWVEVITENFFGGGGRPRAVLEAVRREMPLVFHGVSLGIGSREGAGPGYLDQVKALADAFEPAWVSDHLCWTRSGACFAHELLPLPYTEEALDVVVRNVERAQEHLGRPLVIENVSSYVGFRASRMPEWEFLSEVAARSGCFILLDLNNIIVSATNHGFSPLAYLDGIAASKVWQFHLANHTELQTHKFDDHRGPVPEVVWELFEAALERFGAVSSLVEWDEEVPSWQRLGAEQRQAAARAGQVLGRAQSAPTPLAERAVDVACRPPPGAEASAELEATQRLFFRALTWPTGVRSFLEADGEARSELERVFTSDVSFERIERLDVYANAYFYRLLGVLRELFPRLSYLAGEAHFNNLVTDYLLEHPSTAPDLRRLGESLPGFLAAHELGKRWPMLGEVSALERALARALDCADGGTTTESDLARALPEHWPELCFTFSPATQHLEARHDLAALGELCDRGERDLALALPMEEVARVVLVGRRGHRVYFRSLEEGEARALARLMEGASFGEVCDELLAWDPGFAPARLVSYLRRWLSDGAIQSFALP